MLSYISYNKLRSIILKLEIKLVGAIVKDTVSEILCIEIKSKIFNTEYKKPIYREI